MPDPSALLMGQSVSRADDLAATYTAPQLARMLADQERCTRRWLNRACGAEQVLSEIARSAFTPAGVVTEARKALDKRTAIDNGH